MAAAILMAPTAEISFDLRLPVASLLLFTLAGQTLQRLNSAD